MSGVFDRPRLPHDRREYLLHDILRSSMVREQDQGITV